jgi:hypothetical protein
VYLSSGLSSHPADGNYLATDHDLNAIVRAIEAARDLGRQTAFDAVAARLAPRTATGL